MLAHLELQEPNPVPSKDNPFGARVYKLRGSDLPNTGDLCVQATEEFDSDDEVVSTHMFLSLPLHATEHTALRGGTDNAFLAYHVPRERLRTEHDITDDYVNELVELIEDLPPATKGDERRGIKDTRHYQFKIGCKRDEQAWREGRKRTGLLSLSADYIRDGEKGRKLNDHCAKIWSVAGEVHGKVFKREGKVLRRYKAPKSAIGRFLARPWPGMTINRGHVGSPVRTRNHKDKSNYGMAVLFVCGDFTGGDVIYWQFKVKIALKPGDVLIFPGHLISHSNTAVTGVRHSLVAYAKQETMSLNRNRQDVKNDAAKKARVKKKRDEMKKNMKNSD
jgi:hypothetical protein